MSINQLNYDIMTNETYVQRARNLKMTIILLLTYKVAEAGGEIDGLRDEPETVLRNVDGPDIFDRELHINGRPAKDLPLMFLAAIADKV